MKITGKDICLYIPLCDSGPFVENIIGYAEKPYRWPISPAIS